MATGRVPTTANSPLTAKGDLFGYSTTQARVPVGNNGETLVADSSASQGLRWNTKPSGNKILNSDFSIWQRGTSFPTAGGYTADRWVMGTAGDVVNVSRQTFTPADITAIGFGDAQYFFRMEVVSSNAGARVEQKIENVRTLANQNVTVSFWAKASTSVNLDVLFYQNFGSGGSTQVNLTPEVIALTTSWVRYTKTFTIPSVSGKTIGDNSHLALALRETTASTNITFDFWGVQVEAGNVATAFQTATGNLASELAACQRYCWRKNSTATYPYVWVGQGTTRSATRTILGVDFPVDMRRVPDFATNGTFLVASGATNTTVTSFSINQMWESATGGWRGMAINADVASGLTAGNATFCFADNNASAWAEWNAEL